LDQAPQQAEYLTAAGDWFGPLMMAKRPKSWIALGPLRKAFFDFMLPKRVPRGSRFRLTPLGQKSKPGIFTLATLMLTDYRLAPHSLS